MEKENIVYLLGAGFSAPLGLPVMSNFLEKSRDMRYGKDGDKFKYFDDIYQMIGEFSKMKNIINSDLHNVEEILSLLEMEAFVKGNRRKSEKYKQFIKTVIDYYTPGLHLTMHVDGLKKTLNDEKNLACYFCFVLNLFHMELVMTQAKGTITFQESRFNYNVVTLNYDRVLEEIVDFLRAGYNSKSVNFNSESFPKLSKLHGSVDEDIVPPTWRKGSYSFIKKAWSEAYEMIKNANHLRVFGYSLPDSDYYMKYLLCTAFKDAKHLKTIDVITKSDPAGLTVRRYRDLFAPFHKLRFKSADIKEYLRNIFIEPPYRIVEKNVFRSTRYGIDGSIHEYISHECENAHESFMES